MRLMRLMRFMLNIIHLMSILAALLQWPAHYHCRHGFSQDRWILFWH